jgi:Skp family chaperone for outer membrane proteins
MKELLQEVQTTVYATNEKGDLKQNVRNEFKRTVMNALNLYLAESGAETHVIGEGIAIVLPNTVEGSIVVVVDAVVKALSYDLESEIVAHQEKLTEKEEKAKKLADEKAKKLKVAEETKKKSAK